MPWQLWHYSTKDKSFSRTASRGLKVSMQHSSAKHWYNRWGLWFTGQGSFCRWKHKNVELPSEHSLLGSLLKKPCGRTQASDGQGLEMSKYKSANTNTAKRRMQVHVFVKKPQSHHYTTNSAAYFLKWWQCHSVQYWHAGIVSKFINYWKVSFAMSFKFVKHNNGPTYIWKYLWNFLFKPASMYLFPHWFFYN